MLINRSMQKIRICESSSVTPGIERKIGEKVVPDPLAIATDGAANNEDNMGDEVLLDKYDHIHCEDENLKKLYSWNGVRPWASVWIRSVFTEAREAGEEDETTMLGEQSLKESTEERRKQQKVWDEQRRVASWYGPEGGKGLNAESIAAALSNRFAHNSMELAIKSVNTNIWFGEDKQPDNVVSL